MKAVVFDRCGPPEEVLQVREVPAPRDPGPGEVRVRLLASPVNPSDILYIRGEYAKPPSLPATPGFEGVGIVEAIGSGFLARRVRGKRVSVLNRETGNWQEQVVLPARHAIPVPADLPDEQAAAFFVNPALWFSDDQRGSSPRTGRGIASRRGRRRGLHRRRIGGGPCHANHRGRGRAVRH